LTAELEFEKECQRRLVVEETLLDYEEDIDMLEDELKQMDKLLLAAVTYLTTREETGIC
jgi:bacterioferritin (cytochrome b1)